MIRTTHGEFKVKSAGGRNYRNGEIFGRNIINKYKLEIGQGSLKNRAISPCLVCAATLMRLLVYKIVSMVP